jgi:biofilm PGA synthesis N-glycosyltransferase PgaC
MKTFTVIVGIPAYNEEANIGNLLEDLLRQKGDDFVLERILVYSDGSTDRTDSIVRSISDTRVELLVGSGRQGQAAGQNTIIERAQSDCLVLINADMCVDDPLFLQELVRPIAEGKADLTSSDLQPLPPRGFFEGVLEIGFRLKNILFESFLDGNNFYTCHGAARAFSRRLYSNFRFSGSVGEDAYSYLTCIDKGYAYRYVKAAVAFLRLPATVSDNDKQSFRFSRGRESLTRGFPEPFVREMMRIPLSAYIWGCVRAIPIVFLHPFRVLCYLFVVGTTRIRARFSEKPSDTWVVSATSKQVR